MSYSLILPIAFWSIVVVLAVIRSFKAALILGVSWLVVAFVCARMGWPVGRAALEGILVVGACLYLKLRTI